MPKMTRHTDAYAQPLATVHSHKLEYYESFSTYNNHNSPDNLDVLGHSYGIQTYEHVPSEPLDSIKPSWSMNLGYYQSCTYGTPAEFENANWQCNWNVLSENDSQSFKTVLPVSSSKFILSAGMVKSCYSPRPGPVSPFCQGLQWEAGGSGSNNRTKALKLQMTLHLFGMLSCACSVDSNQTNNSFLPSTVSLLQESLLHFKALLLIVPSRVKGSQKVLLSPVIKLAKIAGPLIGDMFLILTFFS
ncbi:hypothetical protein GUJ93_ZPchr0013g36218 [Zizania palustris]|uniref:Uncharacterized protein n=1 Tax=Zizania palustris TaxID=103762 RepID=A0A8J6BYE5_ZIZPA|nr:hypothetical protein GUJ93_ZPchr0013g36218 [Zizania palustris]